jgi:hypothetical protein
MAISSGQRQFERVRSRVMPTSIEASADPSERHLTAVRRSLGWAQESADRGDYADALGWIRMLEAIGEQLPREYQAKGRAWHAELAANCATWGRL